MPHMPPPTNMMPPLNNVDKVDDRVVVINHGDSMYDQATRDGKEIIDVSRNI